ncbi:MAG: hypothetical protein PHI97_30500 [Desulfobulbus sp.]|nr:hypothetical protein [Desulfobulbus sp.]
MLPLLSANKGERVALIASLSIGLFLFFLSYSIYIQFFKNTEKQIKYSFDETTGTYSHKKTRKLFCASCLIKNIESPLKTLPYGWICLNKDCNLYYNDPSNPQPERKPVIISKGIENPYTKGHRW